MPAISEFPPERLRRHYQGKREYFIDVRIHTEAVIDFAKGFTW